MANKNENKKYHYLYKTTNLINGKYYYGMHSTNNLDDGYLGSGSYLRNAIHRHGKDNFKREIIQHFDNREELVQAEIDLITDKLIQDKLCMNLQLGGEGWNSINTISIKDKNGYCFRVYKTDPRYLSGELIGVTKGYINVRDKNDNYIQVSINDQRYLSGELVSTSTNKVIVKDNNNNILQVDINDERYLSGKLKHILKDTVTVRDKTGNTFKVSIDNPRYLSGELVSIWTGKKHTEETKEKIGKSNSIKQKGEKNSQFGTCWITKDGINKKIKKEELDSFITQGWNKGRKC